MVLRALLSFIALPGIVAVILPPLIAYYDPWRGEHWAPGFIVMFIGAFVLLWCVRDFYVSGRGTLAPWDPPTKLVVVGLYRFVRNPMYIGVLLLVLGWSIYFWSALLVIYAIVLTVGFHVRVVRDEEVWLKTQFGIQWESYQREVSRWLPRLTPFGNGSTGS
ncbi:MAG: isoprenylcysteine carboxylmethyltransferase family protein [Gammaproteobacteria bacterium]|nr:isoprenylcysteine carboxylmethyltransferase family protein [Gammaproteobacteria bacterium]